MELRKSPSRRIWAAIVGVALAMGLAPMAAWAAPGDQALAAGGDLQVQKSSPAEPVDVYMTVSDRGTLAVARQAITVPDLDADGKVTFDEALQVAHEKYCPAGKDGYATEASGWVKKLWGVETSNTSFCDNDAPLKTVPSTEPIKAGDDLVASVHSDNVNYSDHYAYFDKKEVAATAGKAFALNLKAVDVMAYPEPTTTVAANVQVGTWKNGKFTALDGKTTDANGKVTLSFDKPGTYVVSATGTVPAKSWEGKAIDAPLTAPVCVVTVKAKNTMTVTGETKTVKYAQVQRKAVTVQPFTVTKAKGAKSFTVTKWGKIKAKKYIKVNAKTGKVTVKKGAPRGIYKFRVKISAAGNKLYKPKTVYRVATVKVK